MNTIFITGASSGIGKASAILFAERGWTVIATMRHPERESDLTAYDNIFLYPLDITKPIVIANTVEQVFSSFDIDVLFNNAGYGMKSRFEDMNEEDMRRSIDTNVLGMVRVTQKFIPYFKQKRAGLILTTTSLAGEMGLVMDGIYAGDKWAVTGMSEMLYFELAPFGIHVKTLVPGVVKTGFKMDGAGEIPEEYRAVLQRQVDFLMPDKQSLETAQEVAEDVWIAVNDEDKDRMSYVTGAAAQHIASMRQEMGSDAFRKYYKTYLLTK